MDAYINRIKNAYLDTQFSLWAIQLRGKEQIIGFIRADYHREVDSIRLFYALELAYQNYGYMKEAISAIVPYFMEDVQVNRLEAICDGNHLSAGKVLIRCGFNVGGIMRQAVFSNGKTADLISYSIVKDTYMKMQEYKNSTIDDLWLTSYRENGGDPLNNIMRLPKNEAENFAKHLSSVTTSQNDRYGRYFERYYEKRQKTEECLYSQFIKQGGRPQTTHPIYFVLCGSQSLASFYGQQEHVSIKLKDIPSDYLSFTPRDSMHLKDMGLLEYTVWNKDVF